MRIVGVPPLEFTLCFLITLSLTVVIFAPALVDFGGTLFGTEDMSLFIWLFTHYEKTLEEGSNPLFAKEIFYPYGGSLATTATTPLQSFLYVLLPKDLGVYGKITLIQMLSFALGGVFSFALVYKFTRTFLPSLVGSFIFNFSVFHFEKALHHLNYSMSFAFLPLVFLFYYTAIEEKKGVRNLLPFAISLLLLGITELTVAIMAGFIIFLDIMWRYATDSGVKISTVRNVLILSTAIFLSLVAAELLFGFSSPPYISYTLPSIFFIAPFFMIIGIRNAIKRENENGYLTSMVISALPIAVYILFLSIQPSYQFSEPSPTGYAMMFINPVEYLVMPSDFQAFKWPGVESLSVRSEAGTYIGIPSFILVVLSVLLAGISKYEMRFRDFFFLTLFFAFPIMSLDKYIFATTPLVVQPLFPLLSVLRVNSRFILFALLFLSVMSGLLITRVLKNKKRYVWIVFALLIVLLVERWPAMEKFKFDTKIPEIYKTIAKENTTRAIFLYPNFNYFTLLREVYYQTAHNKAISFGILSRSPSEGNKIFDFYMKNATAEGVAPLARELEYNYIVIQKLTCRNINECFYGIFIPIDEQELKIARTTVEKEFGTALYEDSNVIVYRVQS